jgi:hypothetical protein
MSEEKLMINGVDITEFVDQLTAALQEKDEDFCKSAEIMKVDDDERMIYGWASVTKRSGEDVVDKQGDIIEDDVLVHAATEFMKDVRTAKAMHTGDQIGEVVHSFPVVADIAKSLGITSENSGWIVGVFVKSDKVWQKVKSGELKAFSIGGSATREEAE